MENRAAHPYKKIPRSSPQIVRTSCMAHLRVRLVKKKKNGRGSDFSFQTLAHENFHLLYLNLFISSYFFLILTNYSLSVN